ncbi:MAG: M23 family metallopeptidase [Spirochaetaceae bacterium]|jgi:murein DD-endopeptidase MepM/ murein hydrolase activator NlpD|nr:M23 family metallopeptidase [Spirochaetaceae bacterium]
MLNDYSQVTKGQKVARRPHIVPRQTPSLLISVQRPALHRPNLNLPGTAVHYIPKAQSPDLRRPALSSGTYTAERSVAETTSKTYTDVNSFVEPPAEPVVEPRPATPAPEASPAAPAPEPRPAAPAAEVRPSTQAVEIRPAAPASELRPETPAAKPRPQQAQKAIKSKSAFSIMAATLLPKIALGALFLGAAGFFTYNALLWQSGEYSVMPAKDSGLDSRMMEYASNGVAALEPPESINNSESSFLRPSEQFSWQYYTVKRGDSITKISQDYGLSLDAIVASNKINNARELREGDVLRIPNMDGIPYSIVKGDSYEKISERFGVPLNAILDANDIQTGDIHSGEQIFIPGARMPASELKQALGEAFIYPVKGRLSSSFGWRKDPFTGVRSFHKGIDIVADSGTPVKAAMSGKIAMVGFSPILGKYIIITHNDKYQTMYAHLNSVQVVRDAKVSQGERIGEVGNTGYSTGPHLHFVIYKNGRELNPLEQLKL